MFVINSSVGGFVAGKEKRLGIDEGYYVFIDAIFSLKLQRKNR